MNKEEIIALFSKPDIDELVKEKPEILTTKYTKTLGPMLFSILYCKEIDERFKDLLVEKFPEELLRGDLLDSYVDVKYKDILIEKYPDTLFKLTKNGCNILPKRKVDSKYKELLLEKDPNELARVDNRGQNLLFYSVSKDFKQRLLDQHPESARQLDNWGMNFLFYRSHTDRYLNNFIDVPKDVLDFQVCRVYHKIHGGYLFRVRKATETFPCSKCHKDITEGTEYDTTHNLHLDCFNHRFFK